MRNKQFVHIRLTGLIFITMFFVLFSSLNLKADTVLQTQEEFYDVLTDQLAKGVYQKEYRVGFDPANIDIEEIMKIAYEKGGYELLAKFSDWSYAYMPTGNGYLITIKTGFIYTTFQQQKINIFSFLMAQNCKNMSDYNKIKYVYDYLILTCEYDYNGSGIYNALFRHRCCCNGYAAAFLRIMNEMDIPCKFTVGSQHAWNTVYLDGEWYNLDSTWGDKRGDNIDYTFFLKSNEDWEGLQVPEATALKSYPAENLEHRYHYPPLVLITNIIFLIYLLFPVILVFGVIRFLRFRYDRKVKKRIAENEKLIRELYHVD